MPIRLAASQREQGPSACPVCCERLPTKPVATFSSQGRPGAASEATNSWHLWRCRKCHYVSSDREFPRGYWSVKAIRVAAERAGFDRVRIIRREKGFVHLRRRGAFHWAAQMLSQLTCGLVDFTTAFQAELWKGKPPGGSKSPPDARNGASGAKCIRSS